MINEIEIVDLIARQAALSLSAAKQMSEMVDLMVIMAERIIALEARQ